MLLKSLLRATCLMLLLTPPAWADLAEVKKAVLEKFPKVSPESISITKTDHLGLYEIYSDGQLFYTDENVNYFLLGELVEAKTMKNLTEERMLALTAIKFDTLPLDLAIKTVRGSGKRKVAIFSDPDCPYCKRLEKEMANVTDVTIYTFLYPLVSLHPGAMEKAKSVWCSTDRSKTWYDYMLRNVAPPPKTCDTPIDTIVQLGQKHKINGTPTLIFADGHMVPGAIAADRMEKLLGQ